MYTPRSTVYALQLNAGKYYIGRTTRNVIVRFSEHMRGTGAAWTYKYKPERIIKQQYGDAFDEDKWTKQFMNIYGINNVRGGTYSSVVLSDEQIRLITRELRHANDKCLECGLGEHFAKDCPTKGPSPKKRKRA